MHLNQVMSLNSSSSPSPYNGISFENPSSRLFYLHGCKNFPTRKKKKARYSILSCRVVEIPVPKHHLNSLSFSNSGSLDEQRPRNAGGGGIKEIDVSTLGNLCVDIVLNVPKLPPKPLDQRKAYLDELSKTPPDKRFWEAGGNCNMAIAAARLGLRCCAIGHVGHEIYGDFLIDVLHDEGINMVEMNEENSVECSSGAEHETLICWVLVDPSQKHGFCSRADFLEDPSFSWMKNLSSEVKQAIRRTKVLFCNGYGFDELSPGLLVSSLEYAVEVETSVFFDPGPRGKSLLSGTPDEREALDKFLRLSDVLLLTSEEAESLTGIADPILAGQELLRKGVRTKWVIIKMGPKGSLLITMSSISCSPAFKVNVIDTVGCGDSFVAAIAFGFIHNMPLLHTLTIANAVGAATAMGCGAGRNVATLDKVLELVRTSNLNEDVGFWIELLSKDLGVEDITILTKGVISGSNSQLHHIPVQKVMPEMLPMLEATQLKGVVPT